MFRTHRSGVDIWFCWPHKGVEYNETTDKLAKRALERPISIVHFRKGKSKTVIKSKTETLLKKGNIFI